MKKKPRIVLLNKIDLEGAGEKAEEIRKNLLEKDKSLTVIPVSVMNRENMDSARNAIISLAGQTEESENSRSHVSEKSREEKDKESFIQSRSVDDSMEEQFPGSSSGQGSWI